MRTHRWRTFGEFKVSNKAGPSYFTGAAGVGRSRNVSPNPGITNAEDALINVKTGVFEKKQKCKIFFQALIGQKRTGYQCRYSSGRRSQRGWAGVQQRVRRAAIPNCFELSQVPRGSLTRCRYSVSMVRGATRCRSAVPIQWGGHLDKLKCLEWSSQPVCQSWDTQLIWVGRHATRATTQASLGRSFTHYPGDPQLENALKAIGALSGVL